MSLTLDADFNVIKENGCILGLGERGCFDEHGVMPSSIIIENVVYLFYTGWYVAKNSYTHSIGIAVSQNGKTFSRLFSHPILARNEKIPYMANSPFVFKTKDGYAMIFGNGTGWCGTKPLYSLMKATSTNLTNNWQILDWVQFEEGGIYSRCFVENNDIYYSYYNVHGNSNYKIYKNGILLLDTGVTWDQEMTAYPFIYKNALFYNGNGYGKTGIGIAIRG